MRPVYVYVPKRGEDQSSCFLSVFAPFPPLSGCFRTLLSLLGVIADVEVLAGSDTNQLIPLPPPHHHPTTTTTIYPHPTLSHTQPWGGTLPPQPYQEAEGLHPATWLFQGHLAVQMEPHEEENNLPTITPWTHRAGDEGGVGVLMFNIGQSGDILKLVNRLQREEKYFNERLVRK